MCVITKMKSIVSILTHVWFQSLDNRLNVFKRVHELIKSICAEEKMKSKLNLVQNIKLTGKYCLNDTLRTIVN